MVDVDRDSERLIVSQGPSRSYQMATWAWSFVVALGLSLFADRLAGGTWNTLGGIATLGVPLLVMGALVHRWTTTEYRFDVGSGLLAIGRTGPGRPTSTRELPFGALSAVVDRRSSAERVIELVLADKSALVVARAPVAEASALDRVVRELGKVLRLPVELGPGAVLADRFEIERLVGQGGMGTIYRAVDRATRTRVALKLVTASGDQAERAERFARESRLLADLDHPRIARHVAHGTTSRGQAFLAMQWLDGEDLRTVLAKGALSLADSMRVLVGAAEAVAEVHARGIVHRDLKPGNLFLRGESPADLLLLDFGVARGIESNTLLTAASAVIGTPHYMAPEQASSAREILPAADIFSLGCIFYECLTGKRPFDAQQLLGVLARILYDNPKPVSSLVPGVPEAWSKLLSRMLSKQPGARPADGAALLQELALLPPAGELAASEAGTAEGAAAERDPADQVLVCVVLATLRADAPAPAGAGLLDSIRSAMHRFGCPIERLADGSLLATVLPRHSATDQVRIAARCAMYLREQMPEARIAIATGRAPLGPNTRVGDAVDRAAQLLAREVDADGIRLDEVTERLLEGRHATTSHGDTLLLVGDRPELDESRPLLGKPTPCVGRELELVQLDGVLSSAVVERVPKAAVVVGPPGFGKSRLRHELLRRLPDRYPGSAVLIGYGDPLSAGSPYVLLSDALRRHAGIRVGDEPADARRLIVDELCKNVPPGQRRRVSEFLGELCGVPFPADQSAPLSAARGDHRVMSEQIALAFFDWLAAECAVRPVVLVLEDLQWGDALTVKLLETALRDLEQAPLFVLALGRPEVDEIFPKLLGEQRGLSLALRPLSNQASEALIKGVLGEGIGDEPMARIVRLAAGNALFLEELIRAAAEGKAGDVPETVLAMLQARLSRMSPEARLVLRAASVLGETFWSAGVRTICEAWGSRDDPDACLAHLVDTELVARLRASRFPGDTEYAFRHALVCDAASGLLTDADRRAGHLAAGRWLESVGETDGIVLARHAAGGGDGERAVAFFARAAERSVELYDFDEALLRATRGIEGGAKGAVLGVLRSVQSSAYFSMGRWTEAAETGLTALELLPRGGATWCLTVEKLMQVLPNVNDFEHHQRLADELFVIEPAAEARPAHLRALSAQLLGHALTGAHEKGRACLAFIDELVTGEAERDPMSRGYARLFRAIFTFILGDEPLPAAQLAMQAADDLAEAQVMYRLALAHIVESFCRWGLGDHERAEAAARRGRVIAVQIHDDYHTALADWYLGLTLSDRPEPSPEQLEEADGCARSMIAIQPTNSLFEATSRSLSAGVAVARRDWTRAEAHARQAYLGQVGIPPFRFIATAHLLKALIGQGRGEEAASLAREGMAVLEGMAGPVCSEVLMRVAVAEALAAGGDRAGAELALRLAVKQIDARASKLPDASMKEAYRAGRPENRRAALLAKTWFGESAP